MSSMKVRGAPGAALGPRIGTEQRRAAGDLRVGEQIVEGCA